MMHPLDYFLVFVITYIGLGMMTTILLFLAEAIGAMQRPGIGSAQETNNTKLTVTKTVVAILIWPILAYFLACAFYHQQTPSDYVRARTEKAKQKRKKQAAELRNYQKVPKCQRIWLETSQKTVSFLGGYLLRTKGAKNSFVATHFVSRNPATGLFVVFRLDRQLKETILSVETTKKKAFGLCNRDILWNNLRILRSKRKPTEAKRV